MQYADLFIKNNAIFVLVPQSSKKLVDDNQIWSALVGDTTMQARYNPNTKKWDFVSRVFYVQEKRNTF